MIAITIPGYEQLELEYLVLDYNGTLACDGELINGVGALLTSLSNDLRIFVVTADTFGKAEAALKPLPCELTILPKDQQDIGKLQFVQELGAIHTAAVGNGRNDRLMLKESALGVAVVQLEGAAVETMRAADVVCPNIVSALELLTNPQRLTATLRS